MSERRSRNNIQPEKIDILSPELANKFSEMVAWIEQNTQFLKDVVGPNGEKSAAKFVAFILTNPDFDAVVFMGSTGSGKTTVMIDVISFLNEFGFDVRKIMYGLIKALLVDFYGTESWSWGDKEYAFSGYLTALWLFSNKTFDELYSQVFTHESLKEIELHFQEVYSPEGRSKENRIEYIENLQRLYLSIALQVRLMDSEAEKEEEGNLVNAVEVPAGWEFDRGFMAAMALAAREMDRKNNQYREKKDTTSSVFIFMIAPDLATLDFAYRVRAEANLVSPGTYKTLKSRLKKIGLDPGDEFEDTEESGQLLAEIMSYMGRPVIIEKVRNELIYAATQWLKKGTLEEQAHKRAIVNDIKLPPKIRKVITWYMTKVIIAFMEDLLLNELELSDYQIAIALNQFKGKAKMHLWDMPTIKPIAPEITSPPETPKKYKKVLFICKNNVGRSQWAEAIYNNLTGGDYASSAGVKTGELMKKLAGKPSSTSKAMMKSLGLEIGDFIKALKPSSLNGVDMVVVLCEKELCPKFLVDVCGQNQIELLFHPFRDPDPELMREEDRISVRDELYLFIQSLVSEQDNGN